jgi:uncharacterized protein
VLGPYAITVEGRTLYGNVALKSHHVVRRGRHCYLFLVDDMTAAPFSLALADALGRLPLLPGTLVPERLMGALRDAGLVAGEGPERAGLGRDAAAARDEPEPRDAGPGPRDAEIPDIDPRDSSTAGAITGLALFLAQTCNLACSYCYGTKGTYGGGGLMSAETARAAVDWLFANSGEAEKVHIGFFGGEPLLNQPVLREVVAYAKAQAEQRDRKVGFGITTNATLVDEELAAYLAAEGIEPLVSCDGPAETHDRQRPFADGRGSHADVVAGARRLRAVFPGLIARATLCGDTDPFVVRRALEEAGFARCSLTAVSPVLPRAQGPEDPAARGGRAARRTEAARSAQAARRAQAARMLAYRREDVAQLFATLAARGLDPAAPPTELPLLRPFATGEKHHAGCGIGRGLRAVSVDGDIYPCHRFVGIEDARMGDLDDYRADGINDYHRAVVDSLPECRSCWARYLCGGGCFYENRARSGDMRRPDPLFCAESRTLSEDLVAGWCGLSDGDRAYAREQIEKADPSHGLPRP